MGLPNVHTFLGLTIHVLVCLFAFSVSSRSMFLYSPTILNLLKFSVNYAHFYRVLPFQWDSNSGVIKYLDTSKWNPIGWRYVKYLFILQHVYVTIRFSQSAAEVDLQRVKSGIVLEAIMFISFTFISVLQMSIMHKGRDLAVVVNRFVKYYKAVQEEYKTDTDQSPPWQAECKMVVLFFAQSCVVTPLMYYVVFVRKPDTRFFITSVIFTNAKSFPIWTRILIGFPNVWFMAANWACLLCYVVLVFFQIYATIFLLSELKAGKVSPYTTDRMRDPQNVVFIYRNLQLLFRALNHIVRSYLLMFVNNVCITFVIWCNFILIRFHDRVSMETLGIAGIVVGCAGGFLIISYIKLGDVNQRAKILVGSWARRARHLRPAERRLMLRYVRSLRLLRIELGAFGHYQKPTSIRIIGKLVFYTVKFLMMMSRLM